MDKFIVEALRDHPYKYEPAGIPDEPFEVYCYDYQLRFKLGLVAMYAIIFSEYAEGRYRLMSDMRHKFEIDGVIYDFSNMTKKEAYKKFLEIVAERNTSAVMSVSADEIVF